MRPEKNIEQALKQADLNIEINTETDGAILSELIAARKGSRSTATRHPALKLAAAAALIVATLLIGHGVVHDGKRVAVEPSGQARIETLNLVSLNAAYRHGGMEALEEQYRKAFVGSESRPARLSVGRLLTELAEDGES